MFEEKKVPTVSTRNALHAVYNFFPHESLLRQKTLKNLLTPQRTPRGEEGLG